MSAHAHPSGIRHALVLSRAWRDLSRLPRSRAKFTGDACAVQGLYERYFSDPSFLTQDDDADRSIDVINDVVTAINEDWLVHIPHGLMDLRYLDISRIFVGIEGCRVSSYNEWHLAKTPENGTDINPIGSRKKKRI